jgi:hypothetical protein
LETVFLISNILVLPFWLLMILLPNWAWTRRMMASLWVVVPAALLYAVLVVPSLPSLLGSLLNPSLAGIQAALGTPEGATVAWAHFVAFDLFVGRWAYLDNRALGLPALLMSPILFFVLMLGPFGLLLYLAARALWSRRSGAPRSTAG